MAGRLAGMPKTQDSVLHGLLTFSMFTIISTYIITTSVGSIISGVGGLVGQTFSLAGEGIASVTGKAAENVDSSLIQKITGEAMETLRQAGVSEQEIDRTQNQIEQDAKDTGSRLLTNPQNTGRELENLIERSFARVDKLMDQVDREAMIDVIMKRTGRSRAEATQMVDNWKNTLENAKSESKQLAYEAEQKAREVGDTVASTMSKAAIFMFIGLVLGAGAAAIGGKVGEPHDVAATEPERNLP